MKEPFVPFRKYSNQSLVTQIAKLLNDNGIKTSLGNNKSNLDSSFIGSNLQDDFEIKIKASDFSAAEEVLEKDAENKLEKIGADHYLFEFSNEELYEILLQPDEWNELDYKLAQKILKDRGIQIDQELLLSLKSQRLKMLARPEPSQKNWIIAGYIFSFIGGFLGLIIGYSIWGSRKVLPDGSSIFTYSDKDRQDGKTIFYLGIIIFPISILLKILSQV